MRYRYTVWSLSLCLVQANHRDSKAADNMATGNPPTPSGRSPFNHLNAVTPQNAATPPSKRDLTSWWKNFKKNTKKEEEKAEVVEAPSLIFGVPLQDSIKYANVAISLTNEQGESYIYGYVPIVVAKCGVFLKEKGMASSTSLR